MLLAAVLGVLALRFNSQMAFAQAADSLLDVTGALLLAWAVRVAREPRDAGHPMGHTRAESLGSLGIAALAALLSFEVGQGAVLSLLGEQQVELSGMLLFAFALKVVFKTGIWVVARKGGGPALRALAVDARNDILVGVVSVVGFLGARFGAPLVDAWLTLPLAVYIGYSGFQLARENIELLMGAAPPKARQSELEQLVVGERGVVGCRELRAQYLGNMLYVLAHVEVPGTLSVREGSAIAARVASALEAEEDVLHASVTLAPGAAPDEACGQAAHLATQTLGVGEGADLE